MAINFPDNPTTGAHHTHDGKTWTFHDGKWALNTSSEGVRGPAGVAVQGTAPATTDVLWADTSDTGLVITPAGGATGQMLAKSSSANYDTAWVTPITSSDLALKANLVSPTFTGTPTLPTGTVATTQTAADSTTAIATTAFVTTADNLKANINNPTFTGTVTLAQDPALALQAATKQYVDGIAVGINFHESVHAASVTNSGVIYNNGTAGVGATLTADTNRAFTVIDGETVTIGQRVLMKNQTDAKQNGIYTLTTVGSVSAPWVLTRATDSDNNPAGEMKTGDFCFVLNGATNGGYGYINNSTANPIVIGADNITYTVFNAAQALTNGSGINLVSNVLSVDTTTIQARVTDVSDTEIGYLNGVTSAIQTQINTNATPSGVVVAFAGSTAPSGWLLCYGQTVSRTTYATLFAVLSTTYNTGGEAGTDFRLPDLRGRTVAGIDNMGGTDAARLSIANTPGTSTGAETVTLTSAQMPIHTHIQNSHNHDQNSHGHGISDPSHNHSIPANWGGAYNTVGVQLDPTTYASPYYYNTTTYNGTGISVVGNTATNIANTAVNQNTGGGEAHNNMQPTMVLNYIIKA